MPKMQAYQLLSVVLTTLCLEVNAYPMYQGYIPNGDRIPNPCNRSTIWPGVGHQNVYGSGVRNLFGLAFAANGHVWNRALCQMDSDGDGLTNGQELGDPNCTWTNGTTPTITNSSYLSHPGVCEPLGSHMCSEMNSWLMNCSGLSGKLDCPAIASSGAQNFTLRFPVTPVPQQETTYICYQFALPNDTVADIIAMEPVIDNARLLHHMLIFACNDAPTAADGPANAAYQCGMAGGMSCRSLIGAWTVGISGVCLNSLLGFRIGPGGFQYAILQLHWNSPEKTANLTDSSGMRIFYTTQLRPNRGQVAIIGQTYLEIPPRQTAVTFSGTCASACSRKLPRSIFLTSAFLHMHSLGRSGDIRLSRNGNLVQLLDNVTNYDYNTPLTVAFDTPIEIKPGDEIQVRCVFQSTGKNTTTYQGEATSDEMCYGFFAYYPLMENLGFCGQWKSIDICSNKFDTEFESCDFSTFLKLVPLVNYTCAGNCTSTPCAVIMDGLQATGCQNYPDARMFLYAFYSPYRALYDQCLAAMPQKATSTTQSTMQPTSTKQSTSIMQSTSTTLPSSSTQRSVSVPQCSHSSAQADSLYFVFTLSLVVYAMLQ